MKLIKQKIHSDVLNRDYDYYILSNNTTKDDEAFLLYIQDGKDYLEIGDLEDTVQRLVLEQPDLASKLIIVPIHPGDSMERWHAYHHQGKDFNAFMQFMNEEFIPIVEGSIDRKVIKRGMLGDSLAANISLRIALETPSKWSHLLLQSTAVSLADIEKVEKSNLLDWQVYQTVGLYEDKFVSPITNEQLYILSRNRRLHQVLKGKKSQIHYTEQDEKHEWVFWKMDLEQALRFFVMT